MTVKVMTLRYRGACACGQDVAAGTRAGWDQDAKQVVCTACLDDIQAEGSSEPGDLPASEVTPAPVELAAVVDHEQIPPPPAVDSGQAGASLQREHDRRVAKREDRIRTRFPRAGGLILAVTSDPQTTQAFKSGAEGERRAAAKITEACQPEVLFLLNRMLGPGRRDGDIDMIAVSEAGIHVIDVKRYRGAKIEVRRSGGFLSTRTQTLYVGGRDRSAMLDGLAKQVSAVRVALADYPDGDAIPVSAALCFVEAELPLFGTLSIADVPLRSPKGMTAMLTGANGPFDAASRGRVHAHLADRLPPAP